MHISKIQKRSKKTKRTKRTKSQKKTKIQKGRGYETFYGSITVLLDKIMYLINKKNIITNVTANQKNTNLAIDTSEGPITIDKVRDLLLGIPLRDEGVKANISYFEPPKPKQRNLNILNGSSSA